MDPTKVSPTRIDALSKCGVAFRYQYEDKVPPAAIGSWALNGNVIHYALERWSRDRGQNLLFLMEEGWNHCTYVEDEHGNRTRTAAADFIEEYRPLARKVLKRLAAIQERRPDIKMPRRTKDFKESPEGRELNQMLAKWIPILDDGTPWKFSADDPLPVMYEDSLQIAKRYELQWRHRPTTWVQEFRFDVPWRGFNLTGVIDAIEPVITPMGELLAVLVGDYKTDKGLPEDASQEDIEAGSVKGVGQLKHYRQLVFYDIAVRQMVKDGRLPLPVDLKTVPLWCGIDYVRHNTIRPLIITEADHERLHRELLSYRHIVEGQAYLPASKDGNADFCDYGPLCCKRTTKFAGGGATAVNYPMKEAA